MAIEEKREKRNVLDDGLDCTFNLMEIRGCVAIAAIYKENSLKNRVNSSTGSELRRIMIGLLIRAICLLIVCLVDTWVLGCNVRISSPLAGFGKDGLRIDEYTITINCRNKIQNARGFYILKQ